MIIRFIRNLYFPLRFYLFWIILVVSFILGYFIPVFYSMGKIMSLAGLSFLFIDILMIFGVRKNAAEATRITPERLSNGDENQISITIKNRYRFPVKIKIIDEIPPQFQIRNFDITVKLKPGQEKKLNYQLRPVKRGEYNFGNIRLYVSGIIGLVQRRFKTGNNVLIPVYPSYIQMRKYELMAISDRLTEVGIKKIRRISNNKEFEEIREYVYGDDYRTLNWKATARRSTFMVNRYQDEKSQQVFSIIDMGRTMRMPFEGMSLLDYAINASLVISNIAMIKQDKAGLLTYSSSVNTFLPASRQHKQMYLILDLLYKQQTNFEESNPEVLFTSVKRYISQRSLLLLYTNFEGLSSLNRQISFFKKLALNHLLVVIFFENTEVKKVSAQNPDNIEDIYIKTIAEKYMYEKRQMVKELNRYGIHTLLTPPDKLTVNTINKYLELKVTGLI